MSDLESLGDPPTTVIAMPQWDARATPGPAMSASTLASQNQRRSSEASCRFPNPTVGGPG